MANVQPPPGLTFAQRMERNLGPLTGPSRVLTCIQNVLWVALPAYLDEASMQDGEQVRVDRPKSLSRRGMGREFSEDGLPRVWAVMGDMVDADGPEPERGRIDGTWRVTVGALVGGDSDEHADLMGDTYGAAILGAMLQTVPVAHEQIREIRLVPPGRMAPLVGGLEDQRRWLSAVEYDFDVVIEGFAYAYAGPVDLSTLPDDPDVPLDPGTGSIVTAVDLNLGPRQ